MYIYDFKEVLFFNIEKMNKLSAVTYYMLTHWIQLLLFDHWEHKIM